MTRPSFSRTLLAGMAGGVGLNGAIWFTFRLLGVGLDNQGILLDPDVQSAKVVAVWSVIEPLPRIMVAPAPMIVGLFGFGLAHAFIYRWLAPAWPRGILARALRLASLVFVLSFLFWEFFTPFNLFYEPPALIALELLFWIFVALAEALAIAWVMEKAMKGGDG